MSKIDPRQRFSNRVEEYRKHRPSYPDEIISFLKREHALSKESIVADIGSGTGMLTRLLFDHARLVYGVEPNDAMRSQAKNDFLSKANFISVNGCAENTTLPPASIDLVTAGQAFHWFDREPTYKEFKRILKPNGVLALVWNYRDVKADQVQREYEAILKTHIKDYKKLNHKTMTDEKIFDFFRTRDVIKISRPNAQLFDMESLKGRALSSSYVPKPPDVVAERILQQVEALFNTFQPAADFSCANCHLTATENQLIGPGLLDIGSRAATRVEGMDAVTYIYKSIVDPDAYVVEDFSDELMPQNWAEIYSDEDILNIIAYLLTLEG